jgi:hypothetical protein
VVAAHHHRFDRAAAAEQHPHLARGVEGRLEETFGEFRADQQIGGDAAFGQPVDSFELGGFQTR